MPGGCRGLTGGSEEEEEKPRSVEELAAVSIVTDLRMDRGGPAKSDWTGLQLHSCTFCQL